MEPEMLVCDECDLLITMPPSCDKTHRLVCPRCQHTITIGLERPKQVSFALAMSCLLLLFLVNYFPFLTFQAQGRSQSINLLQTASALFAQDYKLIAALIFLFIFCLPLLYVASLVIYILLTHTAKLPVVALELGKLLSSLLPWCMADVFFTGVVVALIKIVAMADIVFGIAFYSYLFFALLFLYLSQVMDKHRLWGWYQQAFERQSHG